MTNLSIIENKISSVKKYLNILNGYKDFSKQEIEDDLNIKGAVERYIYLAVQATIDLAEAVVAYKRLRKPTTMAEPFYILEEEKIISLDLAKTMANMVGFRNIIAHDYEKINYDIVYDILQKKLTDIETFLSVVSDLK